MRWCSPQFSPCQPVLGGRLRVGKVNCGRCSVVVLECKERCSLVTSCTCEDVLASALRVPLLPCKGIVSAKLWSPSLEGRCPQTSLLQDSGMPESWSREVWGHLPSKLGLQSLALTIPLHGRRGTLKALAKTSSHVQEVTKEQRSLHSSTTTEHLPQLTFPTLNLPPSTGWQGENWGLHHLTSRSPLPFTDAAQLAKKQRGSMFINSPLTPAGASAAFAT